MSDRCPSCSQRLPLHSLAPKHVALTGSQRQAYVVKGNKLDPRDPFDVFDPPPEPMSEGEMMEALRSAAELHSDRYLERWEATRRKLVAEVKQHRAAASYLLEALDAWLDWDRTAEPDTEGAILERAHQLTGVALAAFADDELLTLPTSVAGWRKAQIQAAAEWNEFDEVGDE